MKYSLPLLAILTLGALLAQKSAQAQRFAEKKSARPVPAPIAKTSAPPADAQRTGAEKIGAAGQGGRSGDELVAAAAREIFRLPAIEAKIRQRVYLLGHDLAGAGSYLQAGEGTEKFLRLEMKLQVGEQTAAIQEFRNKEHFWSRRSLPPKESSVERINLHQVRLALAERERAAAINPTQYWIMLGGLPKLLENLRTNFDFTAPRPGKLGELSVLVVEGSWKPDRLQSFVGEETLKRQGGPPGQLPHRVVLTLGAADHRFPLFPYRIEYRRRTIPTGGLAVEQGRAGGEDAGELLATLEFFEIRQPVQVDVRVFDYVAADQEDPVDRTAAFLQSVGLGVQPSR